jgi:hypothetical protein
MYISYQYDLNGYIYASVISDGIPNCTNQLVYDYENDPKIFGMLYNVGDKKIYSLQKNQDGSFIKDEQDNYVIDNNVAAIDVPEGAIR